MRENKMEQTKLFQWINMVSFAVNDIVLYLDTHPTDQEAIAYFNHFREVRTKALKEYENNYGLLRFLNDNLHHSHQQAQGGHERRRDRREIYPV